MYQSLSILNSCAVWLSASGTASVARSLSLSLSFSLSRELYHFRNGAMRLFCDTLTPTMYMGLTVYICVHTQNKHGRIVMHFIGKRMQAVST